jgi:hypothetical protein
VGGDPTASVPENKVTELQRFGSTWYLGEDDLARARSKEESSDDDVHSMVEDTSFYWSREPKGGTKAVEVPEEPGCYGSLTIRGVVDMVDGL